MLSLFSLAIQGRDVFTTQASAIRQMHEERPCQPLYLGYPHGPKTAEFVPSGRTAGVRIAEFKGPLTGTVKTSAEAWTVSTKRPVLSASFGAAVAYGDDAVYDRKGDWLLVLSGDHVALAHEGKGKFNVKVTGSSARVTLYEHYYRDHLGYFLWNPEHPLWDKPVMGWCSWMAFGQDVTEAGMKEASRFMAKNLKGYGYDVIQMDDGYQRIPQMDSSGFKTDEPVADLWLKPNGKFPSGLAKLASDISADGMTPGIWVGLYLPVSPAVSGYVTDADGKPHRGPWVNYAVDGLDDHAVDAAYLDTFKGLKEEGWKYIKVDTLRHVLYDNYRKAPGFFAAKGESMEDAYRRLMTRVKGVWGKDVYVLACWGTIPELAGIPDGCRIGEDVAPDVASMRRSAKYIAQFSYLNNVVWHNDPDYMCLRVGVEESKAWASLLALTGCQTMVSDPVGSYDEARVDLLRRVGPTAFVRPQNPTSLPPDPEFAVFHGRKGQEDWAVVGRFAFTGDMAVKQVGLDTLGLDPSDKFIAYDFWSGELLGEVGGHLTMHKLLKGHCQVVSLRRSQTHPQFLGSDRHILQGAVDQEAIRWDGRTLSGATLLGPGRAWSVSVYVPAGFDPHIKAGMTLDGRVLTLHFPVGTGWAKWSVAFSRRQ